MNKVLVIKDLEPPYSQQEVIDKITNHYPDDVKRYLFTEKITTLDRAFEVLRRIDEQQITWTNKLSNTAVPIPIPIPRRTFPRNNNFNKREDNESKYQHFQNRFHNKNRHINHVEVVDESKNELEH